MRTKPPAEIDIAKILSDYGIDVTTNKGLKKFFQEMWFGRGNAGLIDCVLRVVPGNSVSCAGRSAYEVFLSLDYKASKAAKDAILGKK